MRKSLLFLFILLFSAKIYAQNASVIGFVYDETDQSALAFTSIAIYSASDSTLINGSISNENGQFIIGKLNAGNYYLKIQFVGYQTKIFSSVSLKANQKLNVGIIEIKPVELFLNEIKVTGQKVNNLNKIDKQVYKADQFLAAKGGSAIEAIKNLPSVAVNGQGEITLRGSTGFLVLVNGKPIQGDAQTILSQLPANSIENVELITAPSAKYDADGKGGILNITTKKGVNNGFSFIANTQYGFPSTTNFDNKKSQQRFGGDVSINYKNELWDFTGSVNYLRNDNAGLREGDVYTIINNVKTTFPSNGERSFDKKNYGGRFNIGFNPDKNNAFSVGFFAGYKFQNRLADINYTNTKTNLSNQQIIGFKQYYNSNLQNKQGDFVLGNIDYAHNFPNKSSLSFSALYEYDHLYGTTKNRNMVENVVEQNTLNIYKNPLNGFRAKVDYAITIGTGKLESGYQYRRDQQDGEFIYSESAFGGAFVVQPLFTGKVNAQNDIHAIYSQYSDKIGKLEYIAGLRYEDYKRILEISNDANSHNLKLHNLFPSANVVYRLKEKLQLKAGLSKRVQRNNNFELNPIQEREHSETLEQGDPNLLPEFVYLAELGLNKTFDKGSFFTTLYFQDIKNPVQRVNSIYADTILNRVFTNAGKARRVGIEFGTNLQPLKFWSLYAGLNINHYAIDGTIFNHTVQVSSKDWVYSFNTNSNFKLSNSWSLQASVNYLSKRPTAMGQDSKFLTPNAAVKKVFLDGRLTALLQWQNIDLGFKESNRQRISTSGVNFYTTTNYIYETDVLLLNLSFNLNKLTRKLKLPGSEFGEKEF
jgi:ferric enterobactin receptor